MKQDDWHVVLQEHLLRRYGTVTDQITNHRAWKQWATTLASIVVAGSAFWLVEARYYVKDDEVGDRLTRVEVREMIDIASPYTRDRQMILAALTARTASETALGDAIKENTAAIADLRVAIAELRVLIRDREEDL